MRIAVLGGGLAGLAAAFRLQKDHEVVVFEARDRAGGHVRTTDLASCRFEWGPNGFLDNEPATLELVRELGLEGRLVRARDAAKRRLVWRAGKLRALPAKPRAFLGSDCLPLRARLRVLTEPWRRGPPGGDETVRDFAVRRLGRGAADVVVDAFVSGVFAGDPARLSVASAFPTLVALEREHGSLLRGLRASRRAATLTSFDDGLQVLVDALAERVDVRYGAAPDGLAVHGFDRVVCTVPAPHAARLADEPLRSLLARIPTAPVAVVGLVFEDEVPVDGAFGFLAPRGEGLRVLGALYSSSIFPGRAPSGRRLVRVMIGGRRDPEPVAAWDDEALVALALADLARAWGAAAPAPAAVQVVRWKTGIAQYEVGHGALLAEIEAATPPGVWLTGSSYRGIALNAVVREALHLTA